MYGVHFTVEAPDAPTAGLVRSFLPPVFDEAPPGTATLALSLTKAPGDQLQLLMNGDQVVSGDSERVLEILDRYLRNHVARTAPEHVFVHAGVVALDGAAIVIPGASFSGKTSLVTALVKAGATYYSDEYAVFDEEGNVLPFQKPLAIRLTEGDSRQTQHAVTELGGVPGSGPARVGVVAIAQYRSGASWQPEVLSQAAAVAEVLGHTYQGVDRPALSLAVLGRALSNATALKGDRGEAAQTIPDLLGRLPGS